VIPYFELRRIPIGGDLSLAAFEVQGGRAPALPGARDEHRGQRGGGSRGPGGRPLRTRENLHAEVAMLQGWTTYQSLGDWPGWVGLTATLWLAFAKADRSLSRRAPRALRRNRTMLRE
jgi:hypothetical protein